MSKKFKTGFTLLEILVVILIFIILATLLVGAIARARRKADQAKCITNLKSLGEALHMYAIDYSEKFPSLGPGFGGKVSLALLNSTGYVKNEKMFICPAGNGTSATDSDYRYATGLTENAKADSALACDD